MATAENTQAQDNTPDTGNPRKRKVMLLDAGRRGDPRRRWRLGVSRIHRAL